MVPNSEAPESPNSARRAGADFGDALSFLAMSFGIRREVGTGAREATLGTYYFIKDLCTLYDSPGRPVCVGHSLKGGE